MASLLQPPHPATGSTFTWAQEPRASHRTTRPVDNCNGALPARPLSLAERPRTPRGAPTRRRPLRFPEHRPRSMFVRDLGHHLRPVSRTPRDDPVEVKNCHPRRLRPPTARAKKRGGTRESGRGPGRAWGARYLLGRRGRIYQLRVERADKGRRRGRTNIRRSRSSSLVPFPEAMDSPPSAIRSTIIDRGGDPGGRMSAKQRHVMVGYPSAKARCAPPPPDAERMSSVDDRRRWRLIGRQKKMPCGVGGSQPPK